MMTVIIMYDVGGDNGGDDNLILGLAHCGHKCSCQQTLLYTTVTLAVLKVPRSSAMTGYDNGPPSAYIAGCCLVV